MLTTQAAAEQHDTVPTVTLTDTETVQMDKVLKITLENLAQTQAAMAQTCFPKELTADYNLAHCLAYSELFTEQTDALLKLLPIAP